MRFGIKLIVFLLVLLPLGLSVVLTLSPQAFDYFQSNRDVNKAFLSGDAYAEAKELEEILAYMPWRGELWQRVGRLKLNLGKTNEAIEAFKRAQSLGTLDSQGRLWMADAFLSSGNEDQARNLLRGLDEKKDVFILMQAFSLQKELNDTDGVLETLNKAYELDPGNSELNYQLGVLLVAQDPDAAVKHLRVAENAPNRELFSQNLIDLIEGTEEINESSERFIFIGQALSQAVEWGAAERAFQKAIEISQENAEGWALLGETRQQLGEDGSQALERAMQLDPNGELVNGLTALFYRRKGKTDAAVFYLEKALKKNPQAAVWEIEIGNALAGAGHLEKALEHYQKAIEIDPADWVSWRALAVFCFTRNYQVSTTGLQAARQALVIYPDSPALLDLMGTGKMMLADLDSAERFFLQADALDPNQAAILIHLGQLYIARGDKQTGISYLRRATEVAQESRLRIMANQLLIENGGR